MVCLGTVLIDYDDAGNVYLKRFWGGSDDGIMYHIHEKNGVHRHVVFSQNDMLRLCSAFIGSLVGDVDDD